MTGFAVTGKALQQWHELNGAMTARREKQRKKAEENGDSASAL